MDPRSLEPRKRRQAPKIERNWRERQVTKDGITGTGPRGASSRGIAVQDHVGRNPNKRSSEPKSGADDKADVKPKITRKRTQ